jgi:hypothetical protein
VSTAPPKFEIDESRIPLRLIPQFEASIKELGKAPKSAKAGSPCEISVILYVVKKTETGT